MRGEGAVTTRRESVVETGEASNLGRKPDRTDVRGWGAFAPSEPRAHAHRHLLQSNDDGRRDRGRVISCVAHVSSRRFMQTGRQPSRSIRRAPLTHSSRPLSA